MARAGSHAAPPASRPWDPWSCAGARVAAVPRLPEREDVGPDAGVEERDLEGAVGAGVGLADELVEPRLVHGAGSRLVDVAAVSRARGLPVEAHLEADGGAGRRRGQDEV